MKKLLTLIVLLFVFSISTRAQLESPAVSLVRLLINLSSGLPDSGPALCVPGKLYVIHGQRYRCVEARRSEPQQPYPDPYDDRNYASGPFVGRQIVSASGNILSVPGAVAERGPALPHVSGNRHYHANLQHGRLS